MTVHSELVCSAALAASACLCTSRNQNKRCACRPAVVFVAFVIDLAFSLCLAGFLIMHGRLIAHNMTTIEMWVPIGLLVLSELCNNPACTMYWITALLCAGTRKATPVAPPGLLTRASVVTFKKCLAPINGSGCCRGDPDRRLLTCSSKRCIQDHQNMIFMAGAVRKTQRHLISMSDTVCNIHSMSSQATSSWGGYTIWCRPSCRAVACRISHQHGQTPCKAFGIWIEAECCRGGAPRQGRQVAACIILCSILTRR